MGDFSRCPHDDFVGYCDICSPGWEQELEKQDLHMRIYERGKARGAAEERSRYVQGEPWSPPAAQIIQDAQRYEEIVAILLDEGAVRYDSGNLEWIVEDGHGNSSRCRGSLSTLIDERLDQSDISHAPTKGEQHG